MPFKKPEIASIQQKKGNDTAQKKHKNIKQQQPKTLTHFTERTYKKKERMLGNLMKTKSISKAAEMTGITRQTHYDWLKKDKKYSQNVLEVAEALKDELEAKAYAMALDDDIPQVLLATLKAKAKDRGWGDEAKTVVQTNLQVNSGPTISLDQWRGMARKAVGIHDGSPNPQ